MPSGRTAPRRAGAPTGGRACRGTGADLGAVAAVGLFVVVAAVAGRALLAAGVDLLLPFPPLLAEWLPHVGPGTPVAVAVAAAVVMWGPALAATLPWRRLLLLAWAAAAAWTLGLALVDGWRRGVVERLTSTEEYLHDVPRVGSVAAMLRTFADHILTDQPVHWTTHVGAHPPGVFLFYVLLDRVGLRGGGPAGVVTVLVGASACAAVAVAVRTVGTEDLARRVLPFGVLLPGAVWVGVSADGMFAAVLAWGTALVAVGAARSGRPADRDRPFRAITAAVAGGVLLGLALYLSYGLVLGLLLPAAVLVATRDGRAAACATAGALAVAAAFTAAGFWWPTGFAHVRVIYAASIAASRPYAYFVWANLAALAFALGPAVVAGIRRAAAGLCVEGRRISRGRPSRTITDRGHRGTGPALLVAAALAAVVVADLTGLSKAEVERIWLPFAVWLVVPCALLPGPRAQSMSEKPTPPGGGFSVRTWLVAQAVLALAVNHLLLTVW